MKKFLTFQFLLFIFAISNSIAQTPTYTLQVKNLILVDTNKITFDIIFEHTDANVWETASWQYFLKVNSDFLAGGNPSFSYDSTGGNVNSDLPSAFRPQNPQVVVAGNSPGYHELRLSGNVPPGAGNGLIIPQGVPTLIGKMRLTNSKSFDPAFAHFVIRDSCETPLSVTRTKLTAYIGTVNTEVTRCISHSILLIFPITPTANFNSNTQVITMGGSVNFVDSTYNNPTSWSWFFSGGIPASSSDQNPTGIVYNLPGYYNVKLISTNSFGTDTITKSNFIKVNTLCPISWQTNITATDNGNKSDSLKIGLSPDGTEYLDTCLGEYSLPPVPLTGIFDLRLLIPNNDAVKTDFRNDTIYSNIWKMNFQPSVSGYPITFSWNSSDFPVNGSFYLKDTTGSIVNVDMKSQNSYVLTNSAVNILYIDYELYSPGTFPVLSGWNLVSVPLQSPNMSLSNIFPNASSQAYYYNNGYVNSSTLANGKGYWLKFDSAETISISGLLIDPKRITVTNSWNLIGPFDENMPVSNIVSVPSGLITSFFFGFDDGYIIADTLRPGRGYWVRLSSNGYLENGSSDNTIVAGNEFSFDNMVNLNFSDASGKTIPLYLDNGSGNIQNAELPPVPPSGIFDVRYSTDNFIESTDRNQIVKISSSDGPVRLRFTNIGNNKFRIKDNIDGSLLDVEIHENEEIILDSSLDNFTIINESQIPVSYELSQNYPNPFNPSTKIKYQIPNEGKVKISIYNVLGKEMFTLVDKVQQAGKYEINFNAANLASGIYFYKLESGSFTDLKRMVLVK